jgi:UDP-N-acetylglucosamine 1-carboxyvinyltransferase
MSKYIINGGKKLKGTLKVAGNKNAVLPIMAATLLVDEQVTLENVPSIKDVSVMTLILEQMGADVERIDSSILKINTQKVNTYKVPTDLAKQLRASVLLLGPLFARFGKAEISHPGGDIIGKRSISTHLDGLRLLGASFDISNDTYKVTRKNKPLTQNIFLDEPSVTATENIIMASILDKGTTIRIENAALEPHISDLITFLQSAGGLIDGIGTQTVTVHPIDKLHAVTHAIGPDYIEAGTFAALAAVTKGDVEIEGFNPNDLRLPLLVLSRMGVTFKKKDTGIHVFPSELISSSKRIQSGPHPLFPTDLMSPFIVLATQTKGETLLHDPMYESRMFFVDKLIRMGANITVCDPHRVLVYGPTVLHAQHLFSPDIRAGMALVMAALCAKGESIIENIEMVERGYANLPERLEAIGASIEKNE